MKLKVFSSLFLRASSNLYKKDNLLKTIVAYNIIIAEEISINCNA
jgi:hypothetical protein